VKLLIFFFIGRALFIMSLFHVVSQWAVLLGGHEAYEGGSAKEGVEKQNLHAAPQQCTCSQVPPYL
jgi:hypothetical protein